MDGEAVPNEETGYRCDRPRVCIGNRNPGLSLQGDPYDLTVPGGGSAIRDVDASIPAHYDAGRLKEIRRDRRASSIRSNPDDSPCAAEENRRRRELKHVHTTIGSECKIGDRLEPAQIDRR